MCFVGLVSWEPSWSSNSTKLSLGFFMFLVLFCFVSWVLNHRFKVFITFHAMIYWDFWQPFPLYLCWIVRRLANINYKLFARAMAMPRDPWETNDNCTFTCSIWMFLFARAWRFLCLWDKVCDSSIYPFYFILELDWEANINFCRFIGILRWRCLVTYCISGNP